MTPYADKLDEDIDRLAKKVDAASYQPRSWPTARSSCSTKSRSRRSPARRSATRTPT